MKLVISKADEIKSVYKETHKVNLTARQCKVAESVVIKTLVTAGIYPTPRAKEIARLRMMEMSTEEIAEHLHISPRAVEKYYPYERGTYSDYEERKSENAKKIAEWRVRKEEREERGQVHPPDKSRFSPIPHTRRGYWQNVWVGSKADGTRRRERRWYAPCYIPGDKADEHTAVQQPKDESEDTLKKL